jgi:erythromycin esterase
MLRLRAAFLVAVLLPGVAADAARRRDADPAAVEGWLAANATALTSTELSPSSADLAALEPIVGRAKVVGLGDATHGTHEFSTIKLRMIDYLVREMGFDVVALEAPFPLLNRINGYVQGGPGDPRALLGEAGRLYYTFLDAEEILTLVEWMREYNLMRGPRPAIEIAGMDVLDQVTASNDVVTYLRAVDPGAAAAAEQRYACVRRGDRSAACVQGAVEVRDGLAAREGELVAMTSRRAYHDALQNARVCVQSSTYPGPDRDREMAANVRWLRKHRGTLGQVIVWAHNEHVAKGPSGWAGVEPMGRHLANDGEYAVIATATASGSYLQWKWDFQPMALKSVTKTFPPIDEGAYESHFRLRGARAMLIPLTGALPSWLMGPARYNTAGSVSSSDGDWLEESLPAKFDALIYIETTTAMRPLRH